MPLCRRHANVVRRRVELEDAEIVWRMAADILWNDRNPRGARDILRIAIVDGRVTDVYAEVLVNALQQEVEAFEDIFPPLPTELRGDLHALAVDAQNVHTPAVNKQTNDGLAYLTNTEVPAAQVTLDEIKSHWSDKFSSAVRLVMKDMKKWYETKTCRSDNDFLYRRALNGLWARIKSSEHRDELVQRLWEECSESVGVCCDGHLSRLSNVLVGFDASVKPPVSAGELLQQKMAAIAEEDIDVYDKIERAWHAMDELGVPVDERDAWIEAF